MGANATEVSSGERRRESSSWNGERLHAAFAAARQKRPWTVGYETLDEDSVSGTADISGTLPPSLRGDLLRNGPARHERAGQRYGHRWDGDGMLQRFRFSDGALQHTGQYVHTRKYRAESEAGRFLVSSFGTHIPGSEIVPKDLDDVNPANINVLAFGGELLALWEAGSAYRVDPVSLRTLEVKTWAEAVAGTPFSAHPRIDRDGSLWNFGVDPFHDELTLYHAGPSGELLEHRVLHVDQLSPAHDFGITERHLVFLLPPLVLRKDRLSAGVSFAEACQWIPPLGMRVLIVSKQDGSVRSYQAPPGCLFHVANAWEDADGTIHVQYMRSESPMSLMAGWTVMAGEYRHQEGARLTSLTLSPAGGDVRQETIGSFEAEFPVVAPQDVGRRFEHTLCIERSQARPLDLPGFDQVALLNVHSGGHQCYRYGDDWLVEEHVFAFDDSGDPRWIVGPAIDMRARQTVVSVFESANVAAGPVAQARLPYALPLGLHGFFQAS